MDIDQNTDKKHSNRQTILLAKRRWRSYMLRSIQKAHALVHEKDPDSAVTTNAIRKWCKEGKIKYITCGNKVLVNVESLFKFIQMTA
jgi:hypothetical protein